MKRMMISVLLLGLVLVMGKTAFAGEGDGTSPMPLKIAVDPARGNVGTVVTVSGNGAKAEVKVQITLSPQADSAVGAPASGEVMPDANGDFKTTLTIPANTPDGRYAIRAEQFNADGSVLQYAWSAFVVGTGGSGPLLPTTGMVPGTPFTITATLALLLLVLLLGRGVYQGFVKRNN